MPLNISPLILMKVMDDQYSLTLSSFESAVSFSSLSLVSLVTLSLLPNLGPIQVGDISSSQLTTESDQGYNRAYKK